MAQVARVEVTLADVEPIAGFIARVCKADAVLRSMSAKEAVALPANVTAGITALHSAVRDLGVMRGNGGRQERPAGEGEPCTTR